MPGSITLPQIVLDLEEEDRKKYLALEAPKAIVCRFGYMRMIAELHYDGKEKPGCGSRLVIRTPRGIELAEMLTTTCSNAGCGSSVSRKQMLQYIENSGGKNYPFITDGKVLRVAAVEDLQEQQRLDNRKKDILRLAKSLIQELDLNLKLVEAELLLGGERIILHYTSEAWIDFRELVRRLAAEYQTRIEMHQVNARDEARIVADYEKCGRHCCCRQFLKVLKPVSMRSAKIQKATLDPTKISGRCGRLMCCLRYEDETYDSLRKKLPHRQTRVMTPDGLGTVIDTQILTQLVLVQLDNNAPNAAYPLENLQILGKNAPPKPQQPSITQKPNQTPNQPPPRNQHRPQDAKTTDQQRRPAPGKPLQPNEIESAQGTPLNAPQHEDTPDHADEHDQPRIYNPDAPHDDADVHDHDDADHGDRPPQPPQPGSGYRPHSDQPQQRNPNNPNDPNQPQGERRRRRRRRRGRGRGGPPGPGGPNPQGGNPAPGRPGPSSSPPNPPPPPTT